MHSNYTGGSATVIRPTGNLWSFGVSNGPITWSQLSCHGTESSIFNCSYDLDVGNCTHSNDIGVSCVVENGEPCRHYTVVNEAL